MKDTISNINDFPNANKMKNFTNKQLSIELKNEIINLYNQILDISYKKSFSLGIDYISDDAKDFLIKKGYTVQKGTLAGTKRIYIKWK